MADIKQLYDSGWDLIYKGKYQEGIENFKKTLELDKDQPSALAATAIAYIFLDDNETAEKYIKDAITIDPESALAYTARGMLLEGKEEYLAARQDHDQAMRISPDNCFSRTRSAWNFWHQGKNKEALLEFDLLVASKPDCFYAYYWKGRFLHHENKLDEALQAFTKAIQIKTDFALAYYYRGLVFEGKQKYTESLNDFNKALEINVDHNDCLFQRAWCLAQLGKVDEAIEAYTFYINKFGDEAGTNAFNNRGVAYKNKENYEKALADFEQAIRIDHTNKYPWVNRGEVKGIKGDINGAIDDLKEAILIDPEYEYALEKLCEIYEKKGDFIRALAVTAHLRKISPRPHWTYKDPDTQYFTETVYNHFTKVVSPALQKNNERFVGYWEVQLRWGVKQSQSIYQGTSSIVHEGHFGSGYIVLAEKNIWIISIGELSKKFSKTIGLAGKVLFAALRNLDMTSTEKNDKVFCIPHSDIQYVNIKDKVISLGIGSDNWEISTWFGGEEEKLLGALNLARRDMVAELWNPLVAKPAPKPVTEPAAEDIYGQIEKLKKLLDIRAISQEQYDQKVQDLLSRL